jgi:hypothetical protein
VVVDRPWLHRLLADALPSGTVRIETEVGAVTGSGGHVTIDGGPPPMWSPCRCGPPAGALGALEPSRWIRSLEGCREP